MNIMRILKFCLILTIIIACNNNKINKDKPKIKNTLDNKSLIALPKSSLKQTLEVAKGNPPPMLLPLTHPPPNIPDTTSSEDKTNQQQVVPNPLPEENPVNGNLGVKTGGEALVGNSSGEILPLPSLTPNLPYEQDELDKWSQTFFEQCNNNHSVSCDKLNSISQTYTILSDKNKIIDEFKKSINILAEYEMEGREEKDYNTKEKTIQIYNQSLPNNLIVDNLQENSIRNHEFDPLNYPGISITQFLIRYLNINIEGYSVANLYFALNYNQNYIDPLFKAMGQIVKEWTDPNHKSRKVCRTLLKSLIFMSLSIDPPIHNQWYKNNKFLNKLTIKEIFDLSSGLMIQWSRRNTILDNIKKNISFLLSRKDTTAKDLLNLFKIFNKPGSMWDKEFKRRKIESEYLSFTYYKAKKSI